MTTRPIVRANAQALAQDPGTAGVQLLLTYPGDYNLAILQALRIHDAERPNMRIVDQVMTAGFRFVLAGTGALSGLTGADAFTDGASAVDDLFLPWDVADQNQFPLDRNTWRILRDPGPKVILELLADVAGTGETLRLVFRSPHVLVDTPAAVTNPTAAPVVALAAPPAPGTITNGTHSYVFAWTTPYGQTTVSPATAPINVADKTTNGQITVTIPASGDTGITGAKVYRTVTGDAGSRLLVGSLVSATGGGVFTDNVADAGLGAIASATNTAGGPNTVLDGDADAFTILTAAVILELAAVKAIQNTGNTGLPNDVVDRRNQSDIFRSRSKELRDMYRGMIGTLSGEDGPGAASAWTDLDVPIFQGVGALWHPTSRR